MIIIKRLLFILIATAIIVSAISCGNGGNKPVGIMSENENQSEASQYSDPSMYSENSKTQTEDDIQSSVDFSEEISDESLEESSYEESSSEESYDDSSDEISECIHSNGYDTIIKKYTYYEDGVARFVCPDCGYTKDSVISKVIIRGKTEYSYEETEAALMEFSHRYGIHTDIIGTSAEGRNIYSCILGDINAQYHVLIGAAMHGKEYMNTALLLDLIEYYTIGEGETYIGTPLCDYIDGVCFHIIPMINPDGVTISQTS
ncbi:MAG: M14 family zinc carboxypeptidase, partial [Eubacteriales bacterium]|nr:M14 family zinc carboxypeptidase [Eubacteriales bacterium]